jgi:hypothetical protein
MGASLCSKNCGTHCTMTGANVVRVFIIVKRVKSYQNYDPCLMGHTRIQDHEAFQFFLHHYFLQGTLFVPFALVLSHEGCCRATIRVQLSLLVDIVLEAFNFLLIFLNNNVFCSSSMLPLAALTRLLSQH